MILRRRDRVGLALVLGATALLLVFRARYVEPRAWLGLCTGAHPPLACAPRAALLWLQAKGLWGAAGFALGLWAFMGAPFAVAVAGLTLGIAGVIDYNTTWGMLGAALALWGWLSGRAARAGAGREEGPPEPAPPRSRSAPGR